MASVSQLNPYQCDQCGTANIVAALILYQQGTRAYSGTLNSGTSQSYSAQAAAPPALVGMGDLSCFGECQYVLRSSGDSPASAGFLSIRNPRRHWPTRLQFCSFWAWFALVGCFCVFAGLPAITGRSILASIGTGSIPISAGAAGNFV
jgi:hypothetical protein